MTADSEYELILYRRGTAGTITYAFDDSSFVVVGSRKYDKDENDISSVTFQLSNGSIIPAQNLLSSSFAGWSGGVTGALELGDYVRYSVYPTMTGTKTQIFYGKITELTPTKDGKLEIKAEDYMKALMREYPKTVYAGYRDALALTSTWTDGAVVLSTITDSNVVLPFAAVQLADGDSRLAIGGTSGGNDACDNGLAVAQAFYAPSDVLFGVEVVFLFGVDYDGTDITVSIHEDNAGVPGLQLASKSRNRPITLPDNIGFDLTNSGAPLILTTGNKYWIKIQAAFSGSANTVNVRYSINNYVITSYLKYNGSWSSVANRNLYINIDSATLETFEPTEYAFDAGTGYIGIIKGVPTYTPTQTYVVPDRGLVSYYYGTVTNQEIADLLIELNSSPGLVSGSSANQNATSGTFSTEGKKLLEALQELATQYMPSGTWSGYQLAFAHYESGGAQYIGWGKRLTTADSSYVTFSYGEDTTTDSEKRIIDWSGLQKRTDLRPPRVRVIGKDGAGNPICHTVTDRGLGASSFEAKMEGFANIQKVVDDNLATLTDVQSRGDGTIAMYLFDVWEGQIIVSGVYPELIDLDPASASFGSGKVITLNLSPLGLSAAKFKVRGVSVESNQTTITLSNVDISTLNAQKYYNLKGNKTEAFLAPVGLTDNVYMEFYLDSAVDGATYYMELQDSSSNPISGSSRVLCNKHANSALNLNVYHAEFERSNGYSTPPYGIDRIALYTAATGGAAAATYMTASVGEAFDKFKTMRLIVSFMTKIS